MSPSTNKLLDEFTQLLSLALNTEIDCAKSLSQLTDDAVLVRQLRKRTARLLGIEDHAGLAEISLQDLANRYGQQHQDPTSTPIVQTLRALRPVEEWPVGEEFPLPPGMMGMWFLYACSPRTTEYLLPNIVEIPGPVDPLVMEQTWQVLVDRHAALRSIYGHHDGVPYFKVLETHRLDFIWHDAGKWLQEDLDRRILLEASRPFDLTKRPPLRVHLFSSAAERHVLLVVGHHIILDFASFVTLMQEFDSLYPALLHGNEPPALGPADDIRDYVAWHSHRMKGVEDRQWRYWSQKLGNSQSMPEFRGARPRPKSMPHKGAAYRFGSATPIIEPLKLLAQRFNATLYAVLVASLQIVLAHYCRSTTPIVTSLMNGRTRREVQSVIGYLVNPVVLNGALRDDMSYGDVIQQAAQSAKLAFANQDFAFQKVVERLSPPRDDGRPPFQQTLFVLQLSDGFEQNSLASIVVGEANEIIRIGGLPVKGVKYEDPHVQFDMTVAVTAIDGHLKGVIKYSKELFDPGYIAGFAEDLLDVLQEMIADPQRRLADIGLKRSLDTAAKVDLSLEDTCVVL